MNLQESIRHHVDESSGGIKFNDLLARLICDCHEGRLEDEKVNKNLISQSADDFVDLVEAAAREDNMLQTLEYSMPLGSGKFRGKIFIYRPVPANPTEAMAAEASSTV